MHRSFPPCLIASIRDGGPTDEIAISCLADKLWTEGFGRREGRPRELAQRMARIATAGCPGTTASERSLVK